MAATTATTTPQDKCLACSEVPRDKFVRALGGVWHVDCFRCEDCKQPCANKFFPIESPEGVSRPLCERDYFARLALLCANCNNALRGSYITACGKKYHLEHFCCSQPDCNTLFGPRDSYYEHDSNVFCHYHYSIHFASECSGCKTAILRQFVEIVRSNIPEQWHPECYMINKFWNVRLANLQSQPSSPSGRVPKALPESPEALKKVQSTMEDLVYRIWTVLSAFEESSAACISEMLRFISAGQYIDAVILAEKFILHVEVLFSIIDGLELSFAKLGLTESSAGTPHVREARMLCRKTVNFFSLLSHAPDSRQPGVPQDLLSLVTGLAHYLKILIRIALTGALKLEREHNTPTAVPMLLSGLALLAKDPAAMAFVSMETKRFVIPPTVMYGYQSLARNRSALGPLMGIARTNIKDQYLPEGPPSDSCVCCKRTVEEACVRWGPARRWHNTCLSCSQCQRKLRASKDAEASTGRVTQIGDPYDIPIEMFMLDMIRQDSKPPLLKVYCRDCASSSSKGDFHQVDRLEQYAFLLNVALGRLYVQLRKRGLSASSTPSQRLSVSSSPTSATSVVFDSYRDQNEMLRSKAVNLDRKLSTTARVPKRSTVIESPSGKTAEPSSAIADRQLSPIDTTLQSPQRMNNSQLPPITIPGSTSPSIETVRPSFARNNTHVKIISENTPPTSGLYLNSTHSPVTAPSDEGLTLGDLPQLIDAERTREYGRPSSSRYHLADLLPSDSILVKYYALYMIERSMLKEYCDIEELYELIESKKNTFWGKIFKGSKDKKDTKKKGVFAVPLDQLVEKSGFDSMLGSTSSSLRVPVFLDDIISAMKQMDMSVEGIFRKNGNIRRLKELGEQLDQEVAVNLLEDNPVQLAALLKKFLRDMPDPLLTSKLHKLFCMSQTATSESERTYLCKLVALLLPRCNRDTMEVLFVFLRWVASFAHVDEETGSKMDLANLATVISPSILFAKGKDPIHGESMLGISAIASLLQQQDELYYIPEEISPILMEKMVLPSGAQEFTRRDYIKQCDRTYRRMVHAAQGETASNANWVSRTAAARIDSPRQEFAPPRVPWTDRPQSVTSNYSSSQGLSDSSNAYSQTPPSPISMAIAAPLPNSPHLQPYKSIASYDPSGSPRTQAPSDLGPRMRPISIISSVPSTPRTNQQAPNTHAH